MLFITAGCMSEANGLLRFVRQIIHSIEAHDERGGGKVLARSEFTTFLEKERHKSDRAKLPFSLLTLKLPTNGQDAEVVDRIVNFLYAERTRLVDEIGMLDTHTLAIYLFATGEQGARIFLERLIKAKGSPPELKAMQIHLYPDSFAAIRSVQENRRRQERLNLDLAAQVTPLNDSLGHDRQTLTTRDISMGGVFLLTDSPLAEGSELELEIRLPAEALINFHGETIAIHARGRVLRVEEQGMAVQFTAPQIIERSVA